MVTFCCALPFKALLYHKRQLAFFFCQGYYDSSDDGVMDEDGFVSIMARTDDVINVAGHRISTKSLEEVQLKIFLFLSLLQETTGDQGANFMTFAKS